MVYADCGGWTMTSSTGAPADIFIYKYHLRPIPTAHLARKTRTRRCLRQPSENARIWYAACGFKRESLPKFTGDEGSFAAENFVGEGRRCLQHSKLPLGDATKWILHSLDGCAWREVLDRPITRIEAHRRHSSHWSRTILVKSQTGLQFSDNFMDGCRERERTFTSMHMLSLP